ncbi:MULTISPECIES: efflux RND transporter periplasmic adaptor subunit [unclassified Arsukibacterium]|uniref:efflux RND transporter periplasmic adaptor subunit n=1 Tax=unclassified Arsukibacterium TaxID=2635278 RepID=UPI000C4023EC|nr:MULTISPECIES: efflux RND transporter periplasmic adaptor subunit [unclassified Arsukibacterium]MAA93875.1 efflux transporter periplasmic adaptor subunit [Rheinheimera sp.]MBM33326.1 efflux transporter periplasmic adaptor subunit [Rheinheimera sp.]|tara:strand:- start:550 stop:1599 length:1050 start_codon:yes stop_codon:yes gene_type:complete
MTTAWQNAICLAVLLLVNGVSFSTVAQNRDAGRAAQVISMPVEFERVTKQIEAVGSAEAVRSVVIYPAVADKVTAIHFKPGQKVQRGDILLELDARRQRVAVDRARIQLADAERTLERLTTSRQQGAVPQIQLDDAATARDLIKVALTEAETELADRTVRAPFAGVVGLTDVEIGDRITQQTQITTLDNRSQLLINFRAPETALSMLQQQPELTLQPWQGDAINLDAEISQVDSRIDNVNRTIRVRALLDNSDDLYRPGMSFRVKLEVSGEAYAVVPEAALLWGATGAYVWMEQDNKAKKVDVQIKQRLSGRLLVAADLAEGDMLITEGVQTLRAGQSVQAANVQRAGL